MIYRNASLLTRLVRVTVLFKRWVIIIFEPVIAADDEDEADYVNADKTIDLTTLRLFMETPYVVLAGSPFQGTLLTDMLIYNLNEEDCGHAAQIEQKQEKTCFKPVCDS